MKKTKNTIVFTGVILLAALGGILAQYVFTQEEGAYALIQSDGVVTARLPLSEDNRLLVGDEENGYNRICIQDKSVFVEEADCPDKICVRQGRIKNPGEVIACLPHKLIITIEASKEEVPDAVSW